MHHINLGWLALSASGTIRAFIGIAIESPVLVERLLSLQRDIQSAGADLKPVEGENLHITMQFLGDIQRSSADAIVSQVLKGLEFRPFSATLQGVGAFPRISNPRVIWVGVSQGADRIIGIYQAINLGMRGLGLRGEGGNFVPHITLFRVRSPRAKSSLVEVLSRHRDEPVGDFEVRAVQLKSSVLTPRGPIYSTIGEARH